MRTSSSYRALCSHILYRLSAHHGSRCSNRDTRHSRYQTALVLRSSNFAPVRFTFWNAEILSLLIYIRDYQSAIPRSGTAFANGLPHSHASGRLCFWRCLFYVSRPRLRISGSLSDLCDPASQRSTKCTRRGPSPGRVPGCVDCRPFPHSLPTSRRHGLASAMGGAS